MEEQGGYVAISVRYTTRDRFKKFMKPGETNDSFFNRVLDVFEKEALNGTC